MSDLPENWIEVPLPEISIIEMGQSPDSSTYNDQGKGLPFFQGKAEFGKLYPTVRKWCSQPKKIAEAGDILLSVRAPVGPTNLALEKCCIGRGLAAIRAKEHLNQKYLLHYFRNIEPWLTQQGTGSTFTAISGGFIRELQIPLAPLNEQKRIAEKLDSLLARVDSCQTHLERVPQILKRFRQSVLAAATSGRLTEDWREDEKVIEYGEFVFPAAWELSTFDDALTLIDGDRGPNYPKQSDYQESGHCLFLSTKNVRKFGFEFDDVVFISEEKHKKIRSGTLQYGDVIITTRGTLGNVAFYDESVPYKVVRINSGMLILRKKRDNLLGKYLMICIGSPLFTSELEEKRSGSAQPQIPAKTLKTFALPIPPIEEQAEIVRRVEKLFAYAERLEARYYSASEHVERLTPSLLAKAFRGELVSQGQG